MKRRDQFIEQFISDLGTLYRQSMKARPGKAEQVGINREQMYALLMLKRGAMTVKEIAANMATTSSAASQFVDHLVTRGWVEREADESDKRKVWLRLTADGQIQLKHIRQEKVKRFGELFKNITDEELEALVRVTGKLADSSK